jgi:hypothetical protein
MQALGECCGSIQGTVAVQPMIVNPDKYRKRAEECVQLAQSAPASQRPILLDLAQTWLRLADLTAAENALMNGDGEKKGDGSST